MLGLELFTIKVRLPYLITSVIKNLFDLHVFIHIFILPFDKDSIIKTDNEMII